MAETEPPAAEFSQNKKKVQSLSVNLTAQFGQECSAHLNSPTFTNFQSFSMY